VTVFITALVIPIATEVVVAIAAISLVLAVSGVATAVFSAGFASTTACRLCFVFFHFRSS
jgi:hypothetical protein